MLISEETRDKRPGNKVLYGFCSKQVLEGKLIFLSISLHVLLAIAEKGLCP